jgi:hypothetical protein
MKPSAISEVWLLILFTEKKITFIYYIFLMMIIQLHWKGWYIFGLTFNVWEWGDCKSHGSAVVMVWFHTPSSLRDKILVFISTLPMDFSHHLACKNTKTELFIP